jgi:hypothetical protein
MFKNKEELIRGMELAKAQDGNYLRNLMMLGHGGDQVSSSAARPMALNLESGKQQAMKKGGSVKKAKPKCMARGGGCEVRGKTKGRMV